MNSVFYAVCIISICRGGVDSVSYGVDNIYVVGNIPWTTCPYAVGNMGYAVGI